MRELKAFEIKKIEIDILTEIDRFCTEKGLSYFLAYGTLLGAVRHGGFIPWDDDIDIVMPRKDYECLCGIFRSSDYALIDSNTKGYPYPFAKIFCKNTIIKEPITSRSLFGVYVDIFPLDGVPKKKTKKFLGKVYFYKRIIKHKYSRMENENVLKRCFHRVYKLLCLPLTYKWLSNRMNSLCKRVPFDDSGFVGNHVWGYEYKNFDLEWFSAFTPISFEGKKYRAPIGTKEFLEKNYGDYMSLPPVEQRKSIHGFNAFMLDNN